MSGIPLYPYAVTITYKPEVQRKPVTRACANLPSAMAVYDENKGKAQVYSVEVVLTLHKHTAGGKGQ
jgi:hypothetical protein